LQRSKNAEVSTAAKKAGDYTSESGGLLNFVAGGLWKADAAAEI